MHASDEEAKVCQCSENISLQTNIGDKYTLCKEGLIHLKKTDNLEIRNMTTDPDTASYRASLDLRREGITETVPVNHIETCHLAQNHRKDEAMWHVQFCAQSLIFTMFSALIY